MSETHIENAARLLREAAEFGKPTAPVRSLIGDTDQRAAYEVQQLNIRQQVAAGAVPVGCKIGLTSLAVQKQLGVDQPDYGILLNHMEVANGLELPYAELMQPKAEAEIAFVLERDLPQLNPTTADIISAIAYALVCIEVVGSRVAGWDIRITDTIADNASSSHFVLGHQPKKLSQLDVVNSGMMLIQNGEIVSHGDGTACMGSPINATRWLAQTMAQMNQPLKAGDIILSGALGPMTNLSPGDHLEAQVEGLGKVSLRIGQA